MNFNNQFKIPTAPVRIPPQTKFNRDLAKPKNETKLLDMDNTMLNNVDLDKIITNTVTKQKTCNKNNNNNIKPISSTPIPNENLNFCISEYFPNENVLSNTILNKSVLENKLKRKSDENISKRDYKVIMLDMAVDKDSRSDLIYSKRDPELSVAINNPININNDTFFSDAIDTQCFRQLDLAVANEINSIEKSVNNFNTKYLSNNNEVSKRNEIKDNDHFNLSQLFNETQFVMELKKAESPSTLTAATATNDALTLPNQNSLHVCAPTEIDDDDVEADELMDIANQSSQRFLSDITSAKVKIKETANINKTLMPSSQSNQKVLENNKTASQYIELQRSMQEINDENLNDDFLDKELSKIYKSSQYRHEIETVFDDCEKSIYNLNNNASNSMDNMNLNEFFTHYNDITVNNEDNLNKSRNSSVLIKQRLNDLSIIKNKIDPLNKSTRNNNIGHSKSVPVYPFVNKGPFFGLPISVKHLIREYKGISELYDWQVECLNLPAIVKRNNLIYALPTSGGKTLVAEILILREIICRQKNVIFILPFVSIVQEKVWSLSPFAVELEFLVEEYAAGKGVCPPRKRRKKRSVYIATIEKSHMLINSLIEMERLDEIGLIVVDELHLLGELGRGPCLEILLTKLKYLNSAIQIVGMSATIGNLNEIGSFLNADIYSRDFRPIELKEYIKCGHDIMEINGKGTSLDETFMYKRTVDFNYSETQKKIDPDHLGGLVLEIVPENSCLVFCPSKKNCESVALLLCKIFDKKLLEVKKKERELLKRMIVRDTGPICNVLSQTLPYGVAYHHSGLTSDERKHLEDAFRIGVLCVICCTSTLAAGVNLPAKRVILRSPYVGRDFIVLSKYKQMVGRAGRAGMGQTGESILICSPRDNLRVSKLLCSTMDDAISSLLHDNERGLQSFLLSAIGLNIAITRNNLLRLTTQTLMSVQSERLSINVQKSVDKVIQKLFKLCALSSKNGSKKIEKLVNVPFKIQTSQNETIFSGMSQTQLEINKANDNNHQSRQRNPPIILKSSAPLEISRLGKAAIKACIDLEKAHFVYEDLVKAQHSLVLLDYLHLLYLVTPLETAEQVIPDMAVYYSIYVKLEPNQLHTAMILGINEACAMKMISGKSFKPSSQRIVNRFYVTLMLFDLWNLRSVYEVADKYNVNRGVVQNLMNSSATYASCLLRFCEELEEFWAFRNLLETLSKRLSYCCTTELLPLMNLPAVKIGRATQLYKAGFKDLQAIAKATSQQLTDTVEHMNYRVASQLIAAAKLLLLEKVETLREEVQDVMDALNT